MLPKAPTGALKPATLPAPGTELVALTPLLALGLWLANDHLLKGSQAAPAWLTGKLSDVAGVFCFHGPFYVRVTRHIDRDTAIVVGLLAKAEPSWIWTR